MGHAKLIEHSTNRQDEGDRRPARKAITGAVTFLLAELVQARLRAVDRGMEKPRSNGPRTPGDGCRLKALFTWPRDLSAAVAEKPVKRFAVDEASAN